MRDWFLIRIRAATAAAATLTGKRFGLLVASSVVATSAIVAAAATNQPESSTALASLVGQKIAANRAAAQTAAAEPEPEVEPVEEEPAEAVEYESTSEPEETYVPEEEAYVEETYVPEETTTTETETGSEEEAGETEETTTTSKPEAGRIKHVFLISLVSSGYQSAFSTTASEMPYLSGNLRKRGLLLTNYSVLTEASTPNGIATIGGQPPNKATKGDCPTFTEFGTTLNTSSKGIVTGEGCVYPVETETIGEQLSISGYTWKAYMEGMTDPTTGEAANCVYPGGDEEEVVETGGYSARLNPFTHFHSLLDVGECSESDVPITELKKDLKAEKKTANFTYISPDLCSAGVAGQCAEGEPQGAAAADAWLEEVVPQILESPAYKKDGLLIITFGGLNPTTTVEGETETATVKNPLKTGAVLMSKFITKGSTDAAAYNPYSLLRSTEELFGLEQLAKAGDKTTKTFAPELLGETGGD